MGKLLATWSPKFEHLFAERQILLRSEDRVRSLHISARVQKIAAGALAIVLAWGLYSSAAYVLHGRQMANREADLEEAKLAYFDLLSEVSDYQGQFHNIIDDLEANQTYLLSLLASDAVDPNSLANIERELKRSEDERARVALARDDLRKKLQLFEKDLLSVASRNATLENQVTTMRERLRSTQAERAEVAAARKRLGERLESTKNELAATESEKLGLAAELANASRQISRLEELRTQDSTAIAALDSRVEELESELSASEQRRRALTRNLAALESGLAKSEARGEALLERESDLLAELERKQDAIDEAANDKAMLADALQAAESSLARAVEQGEVMAAERKELTRQVKSLRLHVAGMNQVQDQLMSRLSERARSGVEMIERTVAMTGLDVEELLREVHEDTSNQGGPFIPFEMGDLSMFGGKTSSLHTTAELLDSHMDRWEALQLVLASLPLAAPLDQYSLTSRYGKRRDPVNGRSAAHYGIDLSAPVSSPVYTTAPGKVVYAGWRGRYGRLVEIDHGYGVSTRYAHLRSIAVKPGEYVEHRQKIGTLGSSGRSTGPHVHYEVRLNNRPHDPMNFLQAGKNVFKN